MLPIEFFLSLLLLFLGLLFGGAFGAATVVLVVERVGWVRVFARLEEASTFDWLFLILSGLTAALMLVGKAQARRGQINLNIDAFLLRVRRKEVEERDAMVRSVRRRLIRQQNGKTASRSRKTPPRDTP